MAEPPQNPAGELPTTPAYDVETVARLIQQLRDAPNKLRIATTGLTDVQLDTRFRNWTVRQITHHVADSHLNSYIRFKWALTEPNPTIKAYEEADWVQLNDSKQGSIQPAINLLDALHVKWCQLLETLTEECFARTFVHPQTSEIVSLWTALNYYPWHAKHHTAQIQWVRDQHGW